MDASEKYEIVGMLIGKDLQVIWSKFTVANTRPQKSQPGVMVVLHIIVSNNKLLCFWFLNAESCIQPCAQMLMLKKVLLKGSRFHCQMKQYKHALKLSKNRVDITRETDTLSAFFSMLYCYKPKLKRK